MTGPRLAVGVDLGGTTARALLTRGGEVLGQGEAPGGNIRTVGPERTVANMAAAVEAAFREAELTPDLAACAVHAGIAGLATPQDEAALAAVPHPFARLSAQSDALLTLDAYFAGERGVLLIVGTGCIALGRAPDGSVRRRMGWGFPLEQGGGADLGLSALRLVLADWEDGHDTAAVQIVRAEFGTPRAVMEWTRGRGGGDYARFAPLLFDLDGAGDERATLVLARWREETRRLVRTLLDECDVAAFGTWGGLAPRLGWPQADPCWRATASGVLEWAARRASGTE